MPEKLRGAEETYGHVIRRSVGFFSVGSNVDSTVPGVSGCECAARMQLLAKKEKDCRPDIDGD
jgi:hypothetical protein